MNIFEASAAIKDFRQKDGNWYKMAGLVQEVINTAAWVGHFRSNADWIKAAAEISGYQPTVLRRMLRVRIFLDGLVTQKGLLLPNEGIPLASLEILERMSPLSPLKVEELVIKAVKGEITSREVQSEYDSLQSKASSRELTTSFENQATDAVFKSIKLLLGAGHFKLYREIKTTFFTASLIAICKSHATIDIAGFEFKHVRDDITFNNNKYNILRNIVFQSEFFNKFWVVFSDGPGIKVADWVANALRTLEVSNIGVAVLKGSHNAENHDTWYFPGSIIRPSISSPENQDYFPSDQEYSPRWRHLLLNDISKKNARMAAKEIHVGDR